MGRATLQKCPNCLNALDLEGPVYCHARDPLHDVYLCNQCGLAYKPVLNTAQAREAQPYGLGAWTEFSAAHSGRLAALAQDICGHDVALRAGDAVLDIGPGLGWLCDAVGKTSSRVRYVAVEPVTELALHVKRTYPSALVLNTSFDEAVLPAQAFKLIFVCGVDYLFDDIRAAYVKLADLIAPDGVVVIQRNVFLDQDGYIGHEIRDLESLFGHNVAMRNWFFSDQYAEFLSQFLTIRRAWRYTQSFRGTDGRTYTSYSSSFVCSRDEAARARPPALTNYRARAGQRLDELRAAVAA